MFPFLYIHLTFSHSTHKQSIDVLLLQQQILHDARVGSFEAIITRRVSADMMERWRGLIVMISSRASVSPWPLHTALMFPTFPLMSFQVFRFINKPPFSSFLFWQGFYFHEFGCLGLSICRVNWKHTHVITRVLYCKWNLLLTCQNLN